jgi:thiamine kinase-like enzyme
MHKPNNLENQQAINSVCRLLSELNITPTRSEILQDGATLVVRLTDTLVARVLKHSSSPRNSTKWFQKETDIARFLTKVGAPIIPLHKDIEPIAFDIDGVIVNFWEYVQVIQNNPLPSNIGATLRVCHESLQSFTYTLSHLAIIHESLDILSTQNYFDSDTKDLLHKHLQSALVQLQYCNSQPLHGDAHLGNFLNTTKGLLLTDWEDAFLGPIEWDLASAIWNTKLIENNKTASSEILKSYGTYDEKILDYCLIARAAVMSAWYPILYPNPSAERLEKLNFRINWLSQRLNF